MFLPVRFGQKDKRMNYEKNYKDLIKKAQQRSRESLKEAELHHIIPRSLGGNDSFENLALLTPREHYLAHYMLFKFSVGKDKEKMADAFLLMCNLKKKFVFSSRLYEKLTAERRKKVICLQTLEVFSSITAAAVWISEKTNYNLLNANKNIGAVLSGKRKSISGYSFEFYNPEKEYLKQEKKHNKQFSEQKKKVICLQTLEIFESARSAEKAMKVSHKTISRSCITGGSASGYSFEFYDPKKEYEKENMKKIHEQEIRKNLCKETGKVFNSLSEAERVLKIPRSTLARKIKDGKKIENMSFCFL